MADLLGFFDNQLVHQKRYQQYPASSEQNDLEKLNDELEASKLKFVSGFKELIKQRQPGCIK